MLLQADFDAFVNVAVKQMVKQLLVAPTAADIAQVQSIVSPKNLYNAPAFREYERGNFGNFAEQPTITFNEFVVLWCVDYYRIYFFVESRQGPPRCCHCRGQRYDF
jgi:hypothetical protein